MIQSPINKAPLFQMYRQRAGGNLKHARHYQRPGPFCWLNIPGCKRTDKARCWNGTCSARSYFCGWVLKYGIWLQLNPCCATTLSVHSQLRLPVGSVTRVDQTCSVPAAAMKRTTVLYSCLVYTSDFLNRDKTNEGMK